MSVKYQITLPDDLAVELKSTAARLRIPLAQFIRETVEERLRREHSHTSQDPLGWLDAIAATNPADETDLSTRVDEVLYADQSILR